VGWRAFADAAADPVIDPLIDDVAREMTSAPADAGLARRVSARIDAERETRTWPAPGRAPSAHWERIAAWMRVLKTFRTFITVLPLVVLAEVLEAFTRWPATTWLLVTSAVALWAYALFQAGYYRRLSRVETDALTRELAPLAASPRRSAFRSRSERRSRFSSPRRNRGACCPGAGVVRYACGAARRRGARARRRRAASTAFWPGAARGAAHCSPAVPRPAPTTSTPRACSARTPAGTEPALPHDAAAIAAAGNTILVQPGTYRETITFPASHVARDIVMRANGPAW
jgi:hypothetical protein